MNQLVRGLFVNFCCSLERLPVSGDSTPMTASILVRIQMTHLNFNVGLFKEFLNNIVFGLGSQVRLEWFERGGRRFATYHNSFWILKVLILSLVLVFV